MYLLDGDSESAVASWQATFSSTSDRTLVVGSKNIDLGVASASRPLGLKVVGAMDRLAIALNNIALPARPAKPTRARRVRSRVPAARCRPAPRDPFRPEAGTDAGARHQRHDLPAAGPVGQHERHGADVRGSEHGGAGVQHHVDHGKYQLRGGADIVVEHARRDRQQLRCGTGERHARHDDRHHDRRGAGRHRAAQHDAAAQCDTAAQRAVFDKSLNEKPVTEKSRRPDPEREASTGTTAPDTILRPQPRCCRAA